MHHMTAQNPCPAGCRGVAWGKGASVSGMCPRAEPLPWGGVWPPEAAGPPPREARSWWTEQKEFSTWPQPDSEGRFPGEGRTLHRQSVGPSHRCGER